MGIKLMESAWQMGGLHHSEKYVLVALAYYGDDNTKQAWISGSELSALTGISARQVKRIIKSLREMTPPLISPATNVFAKSLWILHLDGDKP